MITVPKGTRDIYGNEIILRRRLETVIREICDAFGYFEIQTPIFEAEELFRRGVGETTDVVSKEMFAFTDKGGRLNALRPEGTAGAVRAYIENGMGSMTQPVKMFYNGPFFRQEKPQAGRYRQYNSFGVEVIGSGEPECDAEVISVAHELTRRLGIKNVSLHINSLGCPDCRPGHSEALKNFLGDKISSLCPTCVGRFNKNPMRVLDCKEESCKKLLSDAPRTLDFIDEKCAAHFDRVKKILSAIGVGFVIDDKIVRGLDYYTRTVFEFVCEGEGTLGSQNVLCGGGRYDGLSKLIGGADTPAVGFGLGIDRLAIILGENTALINEDAAEARDIFIGSIGEAGNLAAQKIIYGLRCENFKASGDVSARSVKAQMKYADKLNARFSAIIGENEVASGSCAVKNMLTGESVDCEISKLGDFLRKNRCALK